MDIFNISNMDNENGNDDDDDYSSVWDFLYKSFSTRTLHTCFFIFSIFIAPGCCLFLCHKYQRYTSKKLIGNPDLHLQNLDHHRQDIKNYCEGVTNQLHLRCNTSEGDTNGGGSDDV